ncbi:MAG: transcription-repair coupling factor, partial [Candidatus Aminicenantes bacterium]|nr:transcription-repair coupling factor [Candidatus Aminicenantes bacterium]
MSLEFLFRVPAFEGLVRALEAGEKAVAIQGVVDAAKPYVLAGLARRLERRIVYVRPGSRSLDQSERECRFFLETLSVGGAPVTLPALSDNPYLEVPPSLDAISRRMRFFYGLSRGERSLVLTEPLGLLQPFPAPATLERAFLRVEVGMTVDRDEVLRTLAAYGYAKQDIIASHGEYAWRGGVADVFSPWEANPLRIEWSGDNVASLREFDTSTQRTVKRVTQAVIPSLREFPGNADFYEVWRKASRRAAGKATRDLEAKVKLVESGELFPSFGHAALAARDHFVPFTDVLGDALFILEDPDEVEKEWRETLDLLHDHYAEHLEAGIFSLAPESLFPPALWTKVKKEAA